MKEYKDYIGEEFGLFIVEQRLENSKHNDRRYLCRCKKCGYTRILRSSELKRKNIIKCRKCEPKIPYRPKTYPNHKLSKTRINNIWNGIKNRCNNDRVTNYDTYGKLGVSIDPNWQNSFISFYNDMYDSYIEACNLYGEENVSIDRIDSNKGYCKENCRWASKKTQANNTTRNIKVNIHNVDMTLMQAYENYALSELSYNTVNKRYVDQGWDLFKSLFTPIMFRRTDLNNKRPIKSPVSFSEPFKSTPVISIIDEDKIKRGE